jgi:hypothetical protein
MIQKETKLIFADFNGQETTEDWGGGIPLSEGEFVQLVRVGREVKYEVIKKTVRCEIVGEDQKVSIVYLLRQI